MNNQVNFIGRVGQNPVTTTFTGSENKRVKFSLAVSDYSSKTDDHEPLWIDVESWNGLAERVLKCITMGREVAISGRLAISKYNKEINGVKVQIKTPVVKLSGFHLCGKRPEEGEPSKKKAAS